MVQYTFSTLKRFYLREVLSMKKYFFLFLLFLPFLTWAEGSIKFVPNKGQWAENIVAQANLTALECSGPRPSTNRACGAEAQRLRGSWPREIR